MIVLAGFVLAVFLYGLASARLERTVLTAPILFTASGAGMALLPAALTELSLDRDQFLLIAELGLVMTLFTDAPRIGLRMLKGRTSLPTRLLGTGMLLSLLLGTLFAMGILQDLTWWEAAILAAILAPTDAGLGQVIVGSDRVPQRIRQALNVEAGLNDGLSVPFLLFFIAIGAAEGAGSAGAGVFIRFLVEQLGYGVLLGLAIGLAGGWLLRFARDRGWMAESLTQLAVLVLPLACVLSAEVTGASMFIAAFTAGLAARIEFDDVGKHSVEFTENWGQLLDFFVFFLFGLLVTRVATRFSGAIIAYAVLSLTVVRILPVAIALRGTGISKSTVWFMGWFGPRGLASIVLGLVYLQAVSIPPERSTIVLAVMATVLLSIVVHGLTALPGIGWYDRRLASLDKSAPEFRPAFSDHVPSSSEPRAS